MSVLNLFFSYQLCVVFSFLFDVLELELYCNIMCVVNMMCIVSSLLLRWIMLIYLSGVCCLGTVLVQCQVMVTVVRLLTVKHMFQ